MKAIVRTAQPDARNWATAQARGSPRWSELRAQSGRAACGEGAVGGSAGESAGTVPMGQSRDSWTGGWHAWFPAWLSDKPATPSTSVRLPQGHEFAAQHFGRGERAPAG